MTEVTYPFHYDRELNPHIQALTLTLAGVTPPLKDGRFTYVELGCGLGLATLVHAAANPDARFIATDIIPEHIAIAAGIAKVNVGTRLKHTFGTALRQAVATGADPNLLYGSRLADDVNTRAAHALTNEVRRLIQIFGSDGKA